MVGVEVGRGSGEVWRRSGLTRIVYNSFNRFLLTYDVFFLIAPFTCVVKKVSWPIAHCCN